MERRVFLSAAAGAAPSPLLLADLDGDGRVDLVTVRREGAGTPKPSTTITVIDPDSDGDGVQAGSFSLPEIDDEVLLGDFNGDGRPDLLTVRRDYPSGLASGKRTTFSVLFNDGKGGFDGATRKSFSAPHVFETSGRIADLDGDKKDDLVVGQNIATRGGLVGRRIYTSLISKGDGTFETRKTFPLPHVLEVNRLADLDGDGRADFVMKIVSPRDQATGQASGLVIGVGDGKGGFGATRVFLIPHILELAVGDFDGDGVADVAALTGRPVGQPNAAGLGAHVQRSTGPGTFTGSRRFPVSEDLPLGRVSAGDLNGDGRADLVGNDAANVGFAINEQGIGFTRSGVMNPGTPVAASAAADIDGDGRQDLIVLAADGSVLSARNAGDAGGGIRFEPPVSLYRPR